MANMKKQVCFCCFFVVYLYSMSEISQIILSNNRDPLLTETSYIGGFFCEVSLHLLSCHVSLESCQDVHKWISVCTCFFRWLVPAVRTGSPFTITQHSSENLHHYLDWDQFISHKLCLQKLPKTDHPKLIFTCLSFFASVSCIQAVSTLISTKNFQLFLNIRLREKRLLCPSKNTLSSGSRSISMFTHTIQRITTHSNPLLVFFYS